MSAPRVRVTSRPNPDHDDGAVLLDFAEDCPYCGRRHHHGSTSAEPDQNGTFGRRVPHCSDHTHATTASGRRARLTADNRCGEWHEQYVLVPAEDRR